MHRALEIVDVICTIVEQLKLPEDKKSLLSLMRVCSIFRRPCAKSVWARLSGLEPLLELCPRPLLQHQTTHAPSALAPSAWDRFAEHAAYVKHMYISDLPCYRPSPGEPQTPIEFAVFHSRRPEGALLPILESLDVLCNSGAIMDWVASAFANTLVDFSFNVNRPTVAQTDLTSMLSLIPLRAPNLHSLRLDGPEFFQMQNEIGDVLRGLDRLDTVNFGFDVSYGIIQYLSLIKLRHLHLRESRVSIFPSQVAPSLFEHLLTVEFHGGIVSGADFFNNVHMPLVLDINVDLDTFDSSELIRKLCNGVSSSHTSLRKLEVVSWGEDSSFQGTVEDGPFQPDDFELLFRCSNLEEVRIRNGTSTLFHVGLVLWDDIHVLLIAQSWKSIRQLELATEAAYDGGPARWPQPGVTWQGLLALAESCRSLCTLSIAVDMTHFQRPADRISPAPALVQLHLAAHSRFDAEDSEVVRDFIAEIWPNVVLAIIGDVGEPEYIQDLKSFCDAFNAEHRERSSASSA